MKEPINELITIWLNADKEQSKRINEKIEVLLKELEK